MIDPRIDLKSPWIAFVLALLVPGAGHLYQGRAFKGAIYMVCILGTFSYGLALGEGQTVYRPARSSTTNYYGYYAQAFVGLPAVPALVQSLRYAPPDVRFAAEDPEKRGVLDEPLAAAFSGRIDYTTPAGQRVRGETQGRVTLEPTGAGPAVRGDYSGTLEDGTAVEVALAGSLSIGPKVFAREDVAYRRLGEPGPAVFAKDRRYLLCGVVDAADDRGLGHLEGTVPRGFWNWFAVPPSDEALDDLNRQLGKVFELALVCTWVAGLLNLLAIWDAVEGPAYGYGDLPATAEPISMPASDTNALEPAAAEKPPSG